MPKLLFFVYIVYEFDDISSKLETKPKNCIENVEFFVFSHVQIYWNLKIYTF